MSRWWLNSRVDSTVTRDFITSHLLPVEIVRLDRCVTFGAGGPTNKTYWDCIQASAKRLFLILVDLGLPDQVFGILDDGWNDEELPLALEDVKRLHLTAGKDDKFDRKFYLQQYQYVVTTIDRSSHHNYGDLDQVPIEVIDRAAHLASKNNIDKVKLPNVPNNIFIRRRYPLGNGPGCVPVNDFLGLVQTVSNLQNEHLISYWGSYTHQGFGYILLTPLSDHNLKSFLSSNLSTFKSLPKKHRRRLVMNWILCLVNAMCFLHSKDRPHGFIKPSSIFLTSQNHIFLVDPTRLIPETSFAAIEKGSFDRDWYDYAAPEQWFRPQGGNSPTTRRAAAASISMTSENKPVQTVGSNDRTTNVQQGTKEADVFSLGCIILELLSYLAKRSTSKFASARAAKHKTAGRGGAVLDSSFHKNLGQVESWMSSLAQEASKKKKVDADGGAIFQGFAPLLHVVAEMLSANPWERPPIFQVQQRICAILKQQCDIAEPHCATHDWTTSLIQHFDRMRMQTGSVPYPQPIPSQPRGYSVSPADSSPPALLHRRGTSSSGYSRFSRASSVTTNSSEKDGDVEYPTSLTYPMRGTGWPPALSRYMSPSHSQSSVSATAP